MRTSGYYKRLRSRRAVRGAGLALSHDISHRHSIARGAAYWHMIANPWTTHGVRPPSLVPMPTSLLRSQTRHAYSTTTGNTDLMIIANPGLGGAPSLQQADSNCKLNFVQFAGTVGSGVWRVSDRNQVYLNTSAETYRPIAMGVRLLNLTQADGIAGCVYARMSNTAPGTFPAAPTATNVSNAKGDSTAVVKAWPEDRELRFVWHPSSQDNSEFTVPSDFGPDADSGDVYNSHQRNSFLELCVTSSTVMTIEVEVVTWYEYIPTETYRDAVDVEMAVVASSDVAAATAAAGSASNTRPALMRPVEIAQSLTQGGIGTAAADAAIAAVRTPVDAAERLVRTGGNAFDRLMTSRRAPQGLPRRRG